MPQGMQILNGAGEIIADTNSYILREVVELTVAAAGAYDASDDAMAANILIGVSDDNDGETLTPPDFTTTGKTLSWTKADGGQSMNATVRVMLF